MRIVGALLVLLLCAACEAGQEQGDEGRARFEPVSARLLGQSTALVTIRNVGDVKGGLLEGCSPIIGVGQDEKLDERVRGIPVAEPRAEDFPAVGPGDSAQATLELRSLDGIRWTKIKFSGGATCR